MDSLSQAAGAPQQQDEEVLELTHALCELNGWKWCLPPPIVRVNVPQQRKYTDCGLLAFRNVRMFMEVRRCTPAPHATLALFSIASWSNVARHSYFTRLQLIHA
jgi:hypothetical protein